MMIHPKTDKKVRFGIIGSNFIVDKVLAAAKQDSRFELAAIYSRTQERADEYAKQHDIPYTFTSLQEMAASDVIDAVYVASPNSLHASQSILCMQHGKHVLCEKPFASNAREAKEMIATAQKYGVALMEAMMPPHTPNYQAIMKHVKEIGTVRRYFASFCKYSSRYDSLKNGVMENAFDPKLSNGAAMDLGVYCIYPMVLMFGKPKSVQATCVKLSTGVDGQGAVNFEYDTMLASILYSKISTSYLPVEIQGEEGAILANHVSVAEKITLVSRDGVESDITAPQQYNNYYYEIAEFITLIEEGRIESSLASHTVSLTTIEILDEIRRQIGLEYPADK